jgi:sarcosine oxidase subunit beta
MSAETTDVLIIGAGAVGLACAWALLERDPSLDVLVLDAGDFACGGSGRNGSAFRTLWSRDFNILMSKESLAVFRDAAAVFDYPAGIDLREEGYLILAHDAATMVGFGEANATLTRLGIPCELLGSDETLRRCPGLSGKDLAGALFGPECGTASPFRYLDALLGAVRRMGGRVEFRRPVDSVAAEGTGYRAETPAGAVSADQMILCTDWAAPELLAPFGIDLPISAQPKEAMVTAPGPRKLEVSLAMPKSGLFIKQLARGNFILTLTLDRPPGSQDTSTPTWLAACARESIALYPALADLPALRMWGGAISKTPDMQAIMGETDCAGLYVAVSAYKGFMLSPAMGRVMAEIVLTGETNHPARALGPGRFAGGALEAELLTI